MVVPTAMAARNREPLVGALEAAGLTHVSTKGSHAKLRQPDGRTAIVPLHKSLARGTLGSILRQAGLTAAG